MDAALAIEQMLDCEVEGNSGEVSFMDFHGHCSSPISFQQEIALGIMEKSGLFGETLMLQTKPS